MQSVSEHHRISKFRFSEVNSKPPQTMQAPCHQWGRGVIG